MSRSQLQVYAVDLDGTLTRSKPAWNVEGCLKAKPNEKMIEYVNKLHRKNFVVIHTARRHYLYEATIEWLRRNNVSYHALKFGKMPADVYIDDKTINPNCGECMKGVQK